MRRRGPVCRGAPASAGYGNGAALQITALVAGAESILHDTPRTERIVNWRGRGSWGTRGSRCCGFWLNRLRREGGRTSWPVEPEATLTSPQAPVCQLFSTVLSRAESWQSGALRLGRGGTRCPHFWTPGLRAWPWLKGGGVSLQAKRGARVARGEADIGGQRMTRPQRRPASLRAFPELGPVMRWPGSPPVSAVFTKCRAAESEGGIAHRARGQCRRVGFLGGAVGVARGRGADRSVAEWSEVKSRRVRRPGRPPSAVSWRGGLPRPSEPASDGRAQPTALGGRSSGLASCPGARGRAVRSGCRRGPGRRKRSG
jgi:hypothetical protein